MIDPRPVTLEGYGVRLEPLDLSHTDALVSAAADGEVWKLWYVAVADLQAGRAAVYMDAAMAGLAAGHMVSWAVRELSSGAIVGSTRYHDIVREIDRVEIGYTFYAQTWQRTFVNTACKRLLLEHAFDALGCQVVGFRVDNLNLRSQQAVEAIGAKRDGILRHFQARLDGSARDTHMYSILSTEWPEVRERLALRMQRSR